jgi:hypothetical protein
VKKIQGPALDTQHWLWEEEKKVHAAQWFPEVPGPQSQGDEIAPDVQETIVLRSLTMFSPRNTKPLWEEWSS